MISARSWIAAALTAASFGLACPPAGLAQDPAPPKDEPLEKLLEKLEQKEKAEPAKGPDKEKEKDKKPGEVTPTKEEGLDKLLEKLEQKEKAGAPKDKEKDKKPGEVAPKDQELDKLLPKDQELDKLLEGLGQTKDAPSPDDKKPGGPGGDGPPPPKGDRPKPEDLKGGEKDLDKELERITGKKEKPKDQRDRKGEEESGPFGQVIKEMRDVEERLGKPDTGEETRKKQTEIVKAFDGLIERMKNAPSQSMAMKMMREGKKPGQPQQPGQPGNNPGAMAQGAQPTKPLDPKKGTLPDDLVKAIWGQLPSQVRDEMSNVSSEHPLPIRSELIKLYYMSLGNKNSSREE